MNRSTCSILCISSLFLLIAWRSTETDDGANFHGTLSTQQGNKYKVNSISIGESKKTKQIPVYELPKMVKKNDNPKEIILEINPKSDLAITYIDLNEVSEIIIPSPDVIWSYQRKEGYRKSDYIEINIISNSSTKSKNQYLIERDIDLYCSGINEAGPEEKKVPLPAIDTLIIEGYYFPQALGSNNIPKELDVTKNNSVNKKS